MLIELKMTESDLRLLAKLVAKEMKDDGKALNIKQVAEKLNVSRKTVERRIQSGDIHTVPGVKPPRVSTEEMERLLSAGNPTDD